MRWPVEVWGVQTSYEEPDGQSVNGQAVWRDDRQTFAVLLEHPPTKRYPNKTRLAWTGQSHGQYPTIAALEVALLEERITLDQRSTRNLGQLGAIAREAVGPAWLVGNKSKDHAVLGVVHPDQSVTQLVPQGWLSPDGFNWGYRGHGTLETADAGIRACFGPESSEAEAVIGDIEPHRRELAASMLAAFPDEFALPLDELFEWVRTREPFNVYSKSDATRTLAKVLDEPQVTPPNRSKERRFSSRAL